MASVDQILRQAANPFDPATFKPGNFWQESLNGALTVASIHQGILEQVEAILDQVRQDHQTRSLLLVGDSGAGKSHLLGRLKQALNPKAFFAYLGPWPDSQYLWRHILRQTVDSLVQVPAGQQESQLILWLQSLSAFKQRSLMDWLRGDRKTFIRNLRDTYPTGIYNASEFFGVLYALVKPELRLLACDWLRGDDLAEDDLHSLGVKQAIDSEDAAQKILANFGRIATETQPIVLCFDNLDSLPRSAEGFIDLQALFSVNSTLHNEKLHNFLVIISIITHTWHENAQRVQPADRARLDATLTLRPINLDQAAALWQSRLEPLHQQAKTPPPSPIYPLARQSLEDKFPGGKTHPRPVLEWGRRLLLNYKQPGALDDSVAALKLLWLKEFQKTQNRVQRIRQFSSPELIQMVQEGLATLQVEDVRLRFLPSPTYALYSLSYPAGRGERVGLAWSEDPNLTSLFYLMSACQKAIEGNFCRKLILIRAEKLSKPGSKGHQLYEEIFSSATRRHLIPTLESVHYLATYTQMVNAARARDLVVSGKTPSPEELKILVWQAGILAECPLFQEMGVVKPASGEPRKGRKSNRLPETVQEFLLNFVSINGLLGLPTLIEQTRSQFPQATEAQIEKLIQQLRREGKIQILDPKAPPKEQLICLG